MRKVIIAFVALISLHVTAQDQSNPVAYMEYFSVEYDKILDDPVWLSISRKMKKYKSFINIDVSRYTKVLKESVLGGK